jgi:hypothetical protein
MTNATILHLQPSPDSLIAQSGWDFVYSHQWVYEEPVEYWLKYPILSKSAKYLTIDVGAGLRKDIVDEYRGVSHRTETDGQWYDPWAEYLESRVRRGRPIEHLQRDRHVCRIRRHDLEVQGHAYHRPTRQTLYDFNNYLAWWCRHAGASQGRWRDIDSFLSRFHLDHTADQDALDRAFRAAALQAHPDRGGSADAFKQLTEEYEQACRLLSR